MAVASELRAGAPGPCSEVAFVLDLPPCDDAVEDRAPPPLDAAWVLLLAFALPPRLDLEDQRLPWHRPMHSEWARAAQPSRNASSVLWERGGRELRRGTHLLGVREHCTTHVECQHERRDTHITLSHASKEQATHEGKEEFTFLSLELGLGELGEWFRGGDAEEAKEDVARFEEREQQHKHLRSKCTDAGRQSRQLDENKRLPQFPTPITPSRAHQGQQQRLTLRIRMKTIERWLSLELQGTPSRGAYRAGEKPAEANHHKCVEH